MTPTRFVLVTVLVVLLHTTTAQKSKATSDNDTSSSASMDGSVSEDASDMSSMASASGSVDYECECDKERKVSLLGASDYCLAPDAVFTHKCGNVNLKEGGECPRTGAMPCSDQGHVLANDSYCEYDKRDKTYKCVASKKDLDIHDEEKKSKKRRKRSSSRSKDESTPDAGDDDGASDVDGRSVLRLVFSFVVLVVGVVGFS